MERFLLNLGKLSLIGGTVIGVMFAVRPLWRERYGARVRCWLWLVLSLIMLLPIDYSVRNVPVRVEAPAQHTIILSQGRPAVVRTEEGSPIAPATEQSEQGGEDAVFPAPPEMPGVSLTAVLFWGYLAGAAVYVTVQWVNYARFRRLVRRWKREITREEYKAMLQETAQALSCPAPNLWVCEALTTPVLVGLVRPVLLLPHESYRKAELRFILRHELCHLKRRDMLYKLVLTAAGTLHWFNPMMYLMLRQADEDIELSCDSAATAGFDRAERVEYSRTLLAAAQAKPHTVPVTTCFGSTTRRLRRRITNVLGEQKKRGVGIAVLVLAVMLLASCAISWGGRETPQSTDGGKTYGSMEDYVSTLMDTAKEKGVDYTVVPEDSAGTGERQKVHDTVEDVRLDWLKQTGTVEGLTQDGTLEVWEYNYVMKPTNAAGYDLASAMIGGMYQTDDGYADFEGQGGHYVFALRTGEGRYTILKDNIVNDGFDLYGYHESVEEALYDWYVDYAGLNLSKYGIANLVDGTVEDAYGGVAEAVPAHRQDGDGWHLYIPVTGWEQTAEGGQWRSSYKTGSELSVSKSVDSVETMEEFYRAGGQTKNKDGAWCTKNESGTQFASYLQAAPGGGCYIIQTCWTPVEDETPDQQGYSKKKQVGREEKELRAMALHFTMDS